jgi:hypothetical protein
VIYFIVTAHHRRPILKFLDTWGSELQPSVRLRSYEELFHATRLPTGTYIFTDLERLSAAALEHAARCWEELASSGRPVRLLNHPGRVLRRYELLRALRQRGVNDFDVYRPDESKGPKRFPVFLRGENDHSGPVTELLHAPEELATALEKLEAEGRLEGKIVTEFNGLADERGLYRKYAAFMIGGRVIPNHLLFGRNWIVKGYEKVVDEGTVAEELRFVRSNPHEEILREIFAIARIDYGRADYGLIGGRIQVYEINTNPTIMGPGLPKHPARLPRKEIFARNLIAALRWLDLATPREGATVPVNPPLVGWRGRLRHRFRS